MTASVNNDGDFIPPPPPPTGLLLDPASDSGIAGDGVTTVTTPTIDGNGEAGDNITLYDGDTAVGTGTVVTGGSWSVTATALSLGTHNLTATQTRFSEFTSARSAPLSVTIVSPSPSLTFALGNFATGAGGWTSEDTYPRQLGDVNGDGKGDIVGFGSNGVYVSLATGSGSFASPILATSGFGTDNGGWTSQNTYPREVADVNGDGKADIVAFGADGVHVADAVALLHIA